MKEIILPNSYPENLEKPPHVLSQLIDMITGKLQFSPAQQKQRWSHLAGCVHCQTFLGICLLQVIADDKVSGNPTGSEQDLLTRLTHIMHETLKEDISAYVEVLVEQCEEKARSRFPALTEHLQACQECRSAAQDLQSWLQSDGL